MSAEDIARFVADLKGNPDLLSEVKAGSTGLDSVVSLAKEKGYDISIDEAKDYIRSEAQRELSDDQLDSVAGGKGGGGGSTSTATVQNTVTATTEAQTAETTTTVGAEAEVIAVVCVT